MLYTILWSWWASLTEISSVLIIPQIPQHVSLLHVTVKKIPGKMNIEGKLLPTAHGFRVFHQWLLGYITLHLQDSEYHGRSASNACLPLGSREAGRKTEGDAVPISPTIACPL